MQCAKAGEAGEEHDQETPTEVDGLQLHLSGKSATGYKGVYRERTGRYAARAPIDNKFLGGAFLGTFDSKVEAAIAVAKHVQSESQDADGDDDKNEEEEAPAVEEAAAAAGPSSQSRKRPADSLASDDDNQQKAARPAAAAAAASPAGGGAQFGLVQKVTKIKKTLDMEMFIPLPMAIKQANEMMGIEPPSDAKLPAQVETLLEGGGVGGIDESSLKENPDAE